MRYNPLLAACVFCFGFGFFIGSSHKPHERQQLIDAGGLQGSGIKHPAHKSARTVKICTNTCDKAGNGVCDDGRRTVGSKATPLFCDLGTDCDDCGPYDGPEIPRWPEGGPVAHLIQTAKVPLFVIQTVTQPPMWVVVTDPEVDQDVSAALSRDRILESGITQVFYDVLHNNCVDGAGGARRLVLDVGANFGYFSTYSALLGCRVVAWEPVPHFRAIAQATYSLNGVQPSVRLRDKVVTEVNGEELEMQVPTVGILGTASVAGINQSPSAKPVKIKVVSERVDSVVEEDVLLMKVDVEGFESVVLRSASSLFNGRNVHNLVLEYNAGVAERMPNWRPEFNYLVDANPAMLMTLLLGGYRIAQLNDTIGKSGGVWYGSGLPALPEVTFDNIRYDMQDAMLYRKGAEALAKQIPDQGLNCPVPSELRQVNPTQWAECNSMPADAHPKSLRSTFPHNTNLWASKDHNAFKVSGLVGAVDIHQDLRKQWATNKPYGMGDYACSYLPADQLVRHRCSCEYSAKQKHTQEQQAACKREETAVMAALAAGKLKFSDLGLVRGALSAASAASSATSKGKPSA